MMISFTTLTWAPNPRNVNPTGTLADADKTKQYWFAGNSNEGGSGYNEIHVNTEVPRLPQLLFQRV